MFGTLFHPSGQPSLAAMRELLSLLPGAVTVCDADTTECLALSPSAKQLFKVDDSSLLSGLDFRDDPSLWAEEVSFLELVPNQPQQIIAWLLDSQGVRFPAVGKVVLTEIANRRVLISSIERGFPDPDDPQVIQAKQTNRPRLG